jgi:hypothetical protein
MLEDREIETRSVKIKRGGVEDPLEEKLEPLIKMCLGTANPVVK